jgi:hypothetical protein
MGSNVTSILPSAFADCISLTNIIIPNSVSTIGDDAFAGCSGLASVTLSANLTDIGAGAFSDCPSLATVTIPSSVTNIGQGAFGICTSLTAITVDAGNLFYCSVGGVLFDRSETTLIQFPAGEGGTYTIPNSVTNIEYGAFISSGIVGVTFGTNLTNIGAGAFVDCWGLATVTIPNSVTNIGSDAFGYCGGLTEVTIGNGVANISSNAFENCFNLASVRIGQSVTNIESEAFIGCTSLKGVYFEGNAPGSSADVSVFSWPDSCTVYYLAGTTGWEPTFSGRPTALWTPEVQISDASFGVRTNQFGFNLNWASGTTVVVEACTNLANPIWYPVATNTLTGGSSYFSDPQWTNYPARFYRLRSP